MGPPSAGKPDQHGPSLVATTIADRYRVVAPLGRGSAGAVYLAIQEPLGREVALKVLRSDLSGVARDEFHARFLREAAVTARLRHPNLVTVHDFGTTAEGMSFVVMERLQGRTLGERTREGPMDPREAARIGAQVARGLEYAHQQGLVHRDVKPNNIVLEAARDGVRAVLVDFGLVKATLDGESVETQVGTYMGTPAYMAPEQARGERHLDGRADLYALGCVLYKMLTGVPPYEADNPLGLAIQHLNEPFPIMAKRVSGLVVPRELEAITRRCLEKEPRDRFRDCGELAEALEAWLEPSPVPVVERSRAAVPVPVVLGLGLLAAIVAGGALVVGLGLGIVVDKATPGADVPARIESPDPHAPVAHPAPVAQPAPETMDEPAPEPLDEFAPEPRVETVEVSPAPAQPSEPSRAVPPVARPAPVSRPLPAVDVTIDGIYFPAAQVPRALAFVNGVDEAGLRAAGVYGRGVNVILENRPFSSLQAFGDTPQVGPKTVDAVRNATLE